MLSHALAMPWAIPTIFGCLVAIVAILSKTIASAVNSISETSLKKRMVNQGFSASEIERIVHASARTCRHCGSQFPETDDHPTKPPKRPAAVH